MLKERTVFVLGAGASVPFGFPSGAKLTSDLMNSKYLLDNFILGDDHEFTKHDVKKFCSNLAGSMQPSVDAFIQWNPHFDRIGRVAMALRLRECEVLDNVIAPFDANWYRLLWGAMTSKVPPDNPMLCLVNAFFITFNYDRSLEACIYNGALHTFPNLGAAGAAHLLGNASIVHVYGKLGDYTPHEPGRGIPFGDVDREQKFSLACRAADGIRLIPGARADGMDNFRTAQQYLENAETICILGFGFDETNVERLGLLPVLQKREDNPPRIVFSTLGKSRNQVGKIANRALGGFASTPYDLDCASALLESGIV